MGTRTGFVRWDYGPKAPTIRLRGTTGIAGYKGALTDQGRVGGMRQLEAFVPNDSTTPARTVPFTFPNFFPGTKLVRIDSVTFSMSAESGAHLYTFYDIQVTEMGPAAQPNGAAQISASDSNLSIGLSVTPP